MIDEVDDELGEELRVLAVHVRAVFLEQLHRLVPPGFVEPDAELRDGSVHEGAGGALVKPGDRLFDGERGARDGAVDPDGGRPGELDGQLLRRGVGDGDGAGLGIAREREVDRAVLVRIDAVLGQRPVPQNTRAGLR